MNRFGNVLEVFGTKVADGKIEPQFDLQIGALGKADRPRLTNIFQARGDIDAITHEVTVGFLDDIAKMDVVPSPVRFTMRPLWALIAGSIRSLRNARRRNTVRSSSAAVGREYPATSAATICGEFSGFVHSKATPLR